MGTNMFIERSPIGVAVTAQAKKLHNALFQQGKIIEKELLFAEKTFLTDNVSNRDAFSGAIAQAKSYVQIRKALSPTIAIDMLSNQLEERVCFLSSKYF